MLFRKVSSGPIDKYTDFILIKNVDSHSFLANKRPDNILIQIFVSKTLSTKSLPKHQYC